MTPTSARSDGPAALLRTGVLILGAGRPEWGRAMLAELDQIDGRRGRWAFTLGCIRCLAFTPPPPGSQRVITWAACVAAVGSLSVVATAFLRYPGMVSGARTWVAVAIFATVLLAYVVVAVNVGARVVDSRLLVASALAGVLIALSWFAFGLNTAVGGSHVFTIVLLWFGPAVALTLGCIATARAKSSRAVVHCISLTAVIAGFTLFLMWAGWTVIAAGRPYDPGQLRDFKTSGFADLATYAVNDSLGTGMILLVVVALISGLSGLAGAAVARLSGTR